MPKVRAKIYDFREGGEFIGEGGEVIQYKAANRAYIFLPDHEFPVLARVRSKEQYPVGTEGTIAVDFTVKKDILTVELGNFIPSVPNADAAIAAIAAKPVASRPDYSKPPV